MTTTDTPDRDPSPDLKRRILESVQSEPAPTLDTVRRRGWQVLAVGVVTALAIFAYLGGVRPLDRPTLLVVSTSLGWSAGATAAAWSGFGGGRSTLGRTTASLVAIMVTLPPLLLAWKIGVSASFAGQAMEPWSERPGFRCLGLSIAMALPLLAAFLTLRLRSDPVHPGVAGGVFGITAGLCAGTLVDLWCPVANVPHLLVGHILPLAIVSAIGAWVGRRVLRP